jgi:hypothetical protein
VIGGVSLEELLCGYCLALVVRGNDRVWGVIFVNSSMSRTND